MCRYTTTRRHLATYTQLFKVLSRPDARQHQRLRRADRSRSQYHLRLGLHRVYGVVHEELHRHGAISTSDDLYEYTQLSRISTSTIMAYVQQLCTVTVKQDES